jgi:ribonuclease H2 subunit A
LQLFVDTVGIEEHYEKKLQQLFPSINCTVRKKADFIYPIVSAGSIGAKVTRDRRMEHWEHPPGELMWEGETGSGYPGDPITKKWLQENTQEFWGPPSCTRFSWRPVKDIVAEQCVEVDYGVPDEDDEEAMEARKATGGGIAQFFAGSAANRASKRVRGSYFSERNMSPCDDF